jgi:hypothetical protein
VCSCNTPRERCGLLASLHLTCMMPETAGNLAKFHLLALHLAFHVGAVYPQSPTSPLSAPICPLLARKALP